MRKYLTFKSVGGGSKEFNSAGEYALSIDDIGGLGSASNTQLSLLLPNPFNIAEASATSISFTVDNSIVTQGGEALYDAIIKQTTATPGGNFELILPEGLTITSFEYIGFIV